MSQKKPEKVRVALDLIRVLEDWCSPFPGYHLYYPSRRQTLTAFAVFVEAVRYSGPDRAR